MPRRRPLRVRLRRPDAAVLTYQAFLRALVARWLQAAQAILIEGWQANPVAHGPGRADASPWVQTRIGRLRLRMEEIVQDPALDEQIGIVARRVSRRGGEELRRVIGLSLHSEVGVPAALEAFRARNTDLIVSLARRQIDDLIPILEEAERTGLRVEDLTDQIRERFQVAESRAELLARDQTLKLSGQLNQMRQQNAGIEQYTWSTSQDERVRPVHAELDGTIQSWASPPVVSEDGRTGHPGDDYQCRCVAIPILPSDQDLE